MTNDDLYSEGLLVFRAALNAGLGDGRYILVKGREEDDEEARIHRGPHFDREPAGDATIVWAQRKLDAMLISQEAA